MPTYDYRCDDCGHQFEKFESIKADPLKECPECKGVVKRLIGAGGGILFKGSGFYTTDYRSQSYQQKASSEKSTGTEKSGGIEKSGGGDSTSTTSTE